MARFGVDDGSARRVLAALTSRGADRAELYFQRSESNSIQMKDGIVDGAFSNIEQGVGLRVVHGEQVGYAFTEDLSEASMKSAALTASAIAKAQPLQAPASWHHQTEKSGYYQIALPWSETGIEQKLPLIRQLEKYARAADPAVHKVSVNWIDGHEEITIVDHLGRISTDLRPMANLRITVTAKKGEALESNGSSISSRHGIEWFTPQRLEALAKQAVDSTIILFDARRPPAGELPVLLSAGASGILLHEAIGHGLEADFNRKKVSIYADKLGKKIAPDFVTIVDDGTINHERGALNIDDEGTPTERTVLVDRGVLASYLHDEISAKLYKTKSTGSGRRQSYRHVPLPRMRCTQMLNGPHSREEIIASIKGTGIIADRFTNGQVDIGPGDYTFYIKNGWLVENGKVTAPLRDTNIIGNGPESLRRITMAAGDSRLDDGGWTCGKSGQMVPVSQGLPSVLVSKMTVGGKNA